MLARINKKDLAKTTKKMKAVAQSPQAQDLKFKALVIASLTPTKDDEETFSRPAFKRRRKTVLKLMA